MQLRPSGFSRASTFKFFQDFSVELNDVNATGHSTLGMQFNDNTRVIQKVKAIFKLRGNREREELAHCAVLTMPVEEFSHLQYRALPSVEWQQRGQKHGRSFAR